MSETNLSAASTQWSNRPADERFWTVAEMHAATKKHASESVEKVDYPLAAVRVEAQDGSIGLVGRQNIPARFTHWAFGQLARLIQAPANYLRGLPATLAAQNINHGLKQAADDRAKVNLYVRSNGENIVRAITSDAYSRIFNHDVCSRLMDMERDGWRLPPARPATGDDPRTRPATEADCLKRSGGFWGSIKPGDEIAPAGAYASDHDMFCFMVNESYVIDEPGNPDGLARGFFIRNSEVGAAALALTTFLYRHVCGNHIVWDAKDVMTVRVRHIGSADRRWSIQMRRAVQTYLHKSMSEDAEKIARARGFILGADKDKVVDRLFSTGLLLRKYVELAYKRCEENPIDGDPRSAWGIAQGLTRVSQETPFADERNDIDRAAGKVLRMSWD